jgi:GNAT superfamily N-acetyltransferase
MSHVVHELGRSHQAALTEHFQALGAEDRRLRFGATLSDESIARHIANIRYDGDSLFGVYSDDLTLLAVAHLASRSDPAELGLSVLPAARGMGVGSLLFERAVLRARSLGIRELFMHCLAQNDAILHIARKAGMQVTREGFEADARLTLPPTDLAVFNAELNQARRAWEDWVLKASATGARLLRP